MFIYIFNGSALKNLKVYVDRLKSINRLTILQ
jgi:hypothetical protein